MIVLGWDVTSANEAGPEGERFLPALPPAAPARLHRAKRSTSRGEGTNLYPYPPQTASGMFADIPAPFWV